MRVTREASSTHVIPLHPQAQAYKMKVGRKEKSSENNDADGVPVVDDIVKPVHATWITKA